MNDSTTRSGYVAWQRMVAAELFRCQWECTSEQGRREFAAWWLLNRWSKALRIRIEEFQ